MLPSIHGTIDHFSMRPSRSLVAAFTISSYINISEVKLPGIYRAFGVFQDLP
jgi:hypothetical protein